MGNLHLVTGYAGASHVTAADAASLNAAIVGSGDYVLNRGSKFAASIVTNNKITVADGDLLMQGRHIRLNEGSTVDLTIENGTSGYYRNDLVVARYTMDSSNGVEECSLVVIKGTAVTNNPSDPEYTSGDIINDHVLQADMPLYRVPLEGLNVQTLIPLFTVITKSLDNDDSDKQESTENLDAGTTLADGDYFPFYDVSVSANKKTLWSNIVAKIRTALFGTVNGILKANGSGVISAAMVETTPTANSANLVTSGGVKAELDKKVGKWELIGSWVYGGSLEADFSQYDELMFVCDPKKDGFNDYTGATINVPTACILNATKANYAYFAVTISTTSRFSVKLTATSAETQQMSVDNAATSKYIIYCYAR